MNINNLLNDFLTQNEPSFKDKKMLLAVSGGIDSMVMLHCFHALQYNIGVAHCNFKLRGKESDLDEELVEHFCTTNNIQFIKTSFDTNTVSKKQKTSIQETARTLRYEWFEQLRKEHHFEFIATAHHQDDNAETILFNLVRGTGILGMCGIPYINKPIIRPLLSVSKKQIEKYAFVNNVPFRTDASNENSKYARNKIRNKVFPLLNAINTASIGHINEFGNYSKFIYRLLQNRMHEIESNIVTRENDSIRLSTYDLIKDEDAYYFLFELLKKYAFNPTQVKAIQQSLISHSSGNCFYSDSHKLIINRHECIITPIDHIATIHQEISISKSELPLKIKLDNTIIELRLISIQHIDLKKPNNQFLDADTIADNFSIRQWKVADFFIPLGMKGRKNVSDLLIDAKVSVPDKEQTFVLCNNEQIASVIKHQISDLYKVQKNTSNVLQIIIN